MEPIGKEKLSGYSAIIAMISLLDGFDQLKLVLSKSVWVEKIKENSIKYGSILTQNLTTVTLLYLHHPTIYNFNSNPPECFLQFLGIALLFVAFFWFIMIDSAFSFSIISIYIIPFQNSDEFLIIFICSRTIWSQFFAPFSSIFLLFATIFAITALISHKSPIPLSPPHPHTKLITLAHY